jgi:hypothetical protein
MERKNSRTARFPIGLPLSRSLFMHINHTFIIIVRCRNNEVFHNMNREFQTDDRAPDDDTPKGIQASGGYLCGSCCIILGRY